MRTLEKGYTFVTENGNIILDVRFAAIEDAEELERRIKQVVGVVEVGLFNFPDVTIYKNKGTEGGGVLRRGLPICKPPRT